MKRPLKEFWQFCASPMLRSVHLVSAGPRHICVLLVAATLLSQTLDAQPRLSIEINRLDFNGNLLKFPDGTFIAERQGELYRLDRDGKFERKLAFDRNHPVPEITAYNTWFQELLAPLADGGFFAVLDFDIPFIGSVKERLARFDSEGRLVSAHDRSYNPVSVGVQLLDGAVLLGSDLAPNMIPRETDFQQWAFEGLSTNGYFHGTPVWGSTRAFAIQGSKIVVGGNFSLFQPPTQTVALLRVNSDLFLDTLLQPPLCKDISQLAVQLDGRILACGRLTNDQGAFESEASVFRLNADGSFDRRIFQIASNDWQQPAFAIEPSGDIIILNSPYASEDVPRYPKLSRYHPDGTLKEMMTMPDRLPWGSWEGFDRIEFLADGSFAAHIGFANDGPSGLYPDHWIGFKANGQLHPSFPPSPLAYFVVYLSVTNLIRDHSVRIEQSKDLLLWDQILPNAQWSDANDVVKFQVWEGRMAEDSGPHFFRVVQ